MNPESTENNDVEIMKERLRRSRKVSPEEKLRMIQAAMELFREARTNKKSK